MLTWWLQSGTAFHLHSLDWLGTSQRAYYRYFKLNTKVTQTDDVVPIWGICCAPIVSWKRVIYLWAIEEIKCATDAYILNKLKLQCIKWFFMLLLARIRCSPHVTSPVWFFFLHLLKEQVVFLQWGYPQWATTSFSYHMQTCRLQLDILGIPRHFEDLYL